MNELKHTWIVGDAVKITAKVDYHGCIGEIISVNEKEPHPIKVYFEDGGWACYSPAEISQAFY